MSQPQGFSDKGAFVWRVADKLRGNFRPHEYGQVILPLLVLRRLDEGLTNSEPPANQLAVKVSGPSAGFARYSRRSVDGQRQSRAEQ